LALSLSRKILILVSVPVVLEIGLVGSLFVLLGKAEAARAKAVHARELGSHINLLLATAMRRGSTFMEGRAFAPNKAKSRLELLKEKLDSETKLVEILVKGDPVERQAWARINEVFRRIDQGFIAASLLYEKGEREESAIVWRKVRQDVDTFFDYCNRLTDEQSRVQELRQAEIDTYDKYWRYALGLSLGMSVLIAFGLAIFFNRSTTDRLKVLIDNSKLLAAGQPPAASLSGSDELAVLDRTYSQMYRDLLVLRQKERAVLDNAGEIICSIDENRRIVDINEAARQTWGFAEDELLGKRILDLIVEEERSEVSAHLDSVMSPAGGQKKFEAAITAAGGSRVEMHWSITWSPSERFLYCVLSDVSEQKELERMKEEFVAMISHDLRTPLSSVLVSLDTLEKDAGKLEARGQESLHRAQKNLQLSLSLINQLLDLEKMEAGLSALTFDAVSSREMFTRAAEAVAELAARKQITINLPTSNTEIVADPERLVQVVINLLGNALKYAPAGSTIKVSEAVMDDKVRVTVSDSGPGIAPSEQAFVFGRFHQLAADAGPGGSGLGLAICKSIVEAHGGTIGLMSTPGAGSQFWFEIPVDASDAFDA